jgi:hypothetical protein
MWIFRGAPSLSLQAAILDNLTGESRQLQSRRVPQAGERWAKGTGKLRHGKRTTKSAENRSIDAACFTPHYERFMGIRPHAPTCASTLQSKFYICVTSPSRASGILIIDVIVTRVFFLRLVRVRSEVFYVPRACHSGLPGGCGASANP